MYGYTRHFRPIWYRICLGDAREVYYCVPRANGTVDVDAKRAGSKGR